MSNECGLEHSFFFCNAENSTNKISFCVCVWVSTWKAWPCYCVIDSSNCVARVTMFCVGFYNAFFPRNFCIPSSNLFCLLVNDWMNLFKKKKKKNQTKTDQCAFYLLGINKMKISDVDKKKFVPIISCTKFNPCYFWGTYTTWVGIFYKKNGRKKKNWNQSISCSILIFIFFSSEKI